MRENMYLEWVEKDIQYISELKEELIRWDKIYKAKVFDGNWGRLTGNVVKAIKIELEIVLQNIRDNIKKAEEHRRGLDASYKGQLTENKRDVTSEERQPRDTFVEPARVKQEDLGVTQKEDDDYWGEDEPGQVCDGVADCF